MAEVTSPAAESTTPTATVDDSAHYEAAGALLMGDEPEAQAEPEATPAPEPEPAVAEAAEPEPEQPKDEKRGEVAWRKAKVIERERSLKRQVDEFQRTLETFRAEREQLLPLAQLSELAKRDPVAALDAIAERAGLDPTKLYERLTQRQLNQPDPDPPAVAELRAELAALKGQLAQREQQATQRMTNEQVQSHIEADVAKVVAELRNAESYPEIEAWDETQLLASARYEVSQIYRNRQFSTSHADVAAKIHGIAKDEAGRWQKWVEKRRGNGIPAANDGPGTPAAQAVKPGGTKPRSPSNRDQGSGPKDPRQLSASERLELSAALLFGDQS